MATTKRTTAKAKGSASSSGRRQASASAAPAKSSARPATRRQSSAAAAPATPARRQRIPVPTEPSPVEEIVIPTLSPMELYRQEKQRRSRTVKTEADPLAEARREYLALLAAEAEKGKGGRPKGSGKKKEEPIEED
jgi:hypothetical protein